MSEPATMNREAREILLRAAHKRQQDKLAAERLNEQRKRQEIARIAKVGTYRPAEGTLLWLILQAIADLPEPFTLADIVLASWKAHPDRFGLAGHPEHPDSKNISSYIYGTRGLVARKMLLKAKECFWRAKETNGHV